MSPRLSGGSYYIRGGADTLSDGGPDSLADDINFVVESQMFSGSFTLRNDIANVGVGLLSDQRATAGTSAERLALEATQMCSFNPSERSPDAPSLSSGQIQLVSPADAGLGSLWPEGMTEYSVDGVSTCNVDHQGLVTQIDTRDLQNTTFYVFRNADGRRIGSRWGLNERDLDCNGPWFAEHDVSGTGRNRQCPTFDPHGAAAGVVTFMSRGLSGGQGPFRSGAMQFELDYQDEGQDRVGHGIQPGDALTVVAVNHATGYVGTVETSAGGLGELSGTLLDTIVLRPPQLRIWAERTISDANGTAQEDGDDYHIGSDGSALVTDRSVTIYTEWLDWDGSPLPEDLPSMTGRFSRVTGTVGGTDRLVTSGTDAAGDFDIGEFAIRTGRHTQVIELPSSESGIDRSHLYVHVSAESRELGRENQEVDLFSPTDVCYWEAGEPDSTQTTYSTDGERCGDGQDNNYNRQIDEGCPEVPTYVCHGREPYTPDPDCQECAECDDCEGCRQSCCMACQPCFDAYCPGPDSPCDGPGEECEACDDTCLDTEFFLTERPWHYVPILVPEYNHAATIEGRRAAVSSGRNDPGPVYDWVYRPEMHFSVVELQNLEVNRVTEDGDVVPLVGDDAGPPVFESSDAELVAGADVVDEEATDELGRLDGEREYVFGSGESAGTPVDDGEGGTYWHFGPEDINDLDGDDMATLWLAQEGDEGNVLWEFDFDVERREWLRRYHHARFREGGLPTAEDVFVTGDGVMPIDAYQVLEALVTEDSELSVWVVSSHNEDGAPSELYGRACT